MAATVATWRFASAVYAVPGPTITSTAAMLSVPYASAVEDELRKLLGAEETDAEGWLRAGGRVVLVEGPEQAMAAANAIAPEHLELMCAGAEDLVPLVRNAGAVFVGVDASAVIGR